MQILDLISPNYVGEDRIAITVDPVSKPLTVGRIITLNFDYSATKPVGVVKPLKLILQPAFGDGAGYQEVVFDRFVPSSYAFQVNGAGQYLAVIREVGHNLWQGRIVLDVAGDQYQEPRSRRIV